MQDIRDINRKQLDWLNELVTNGRDDGDRRGRDGRYARDDGDDGDDDDYDDDDVDDDDDYDDDDVDDDDGDGKNKGSLFYNLDYNFT